MEKVVVLSLWTKPFNDKAKRRHTLYMAALSLAFAQRSGYKVHMHTDDYGYELLKDFCYDNPEGIYILATGSHVVCAIDGDGSCDSV
jgi:hypothetical protein